MMSCYRQGGAKASGFLARAEQIFWRAMEVEGQAEINNAEAQMAMSQAVIGAVRDNVWEPAHQYLLRHKKVADGVGVAVDVIGVIAGAAFVLAFFPEIGALAIVTGAAAGFGVPRPATMPAKSANARKVGRPKSTNSRRRR